jgi:hypothetical protein
MTTRLPVIGSTAASTAFCHERLEGPDGEVLWLDGNGKITAGNGTLHEPRANALSLPQIESCPYRTPTCEKACYVHNLQKAQPDLHALYVHNLSIVKRIVDNFGRSWASPGGAAWADQWATALARWIETHAQGGFRWHVSGDVMSEAHAAWIACVVARSPSVRHWIYTRSFPFAEPLIGVCTERGGNLALNLSCDRDNFWLAKRFRERYGVGRYAYLVTDRDLKVDLWGTDVPLECFDADETTDEALRVDLPADLGPADVIFPDYALRPRQFATLAEAPFWQALAPEQRKIVCPVDGHGKSEARRCGIDRCDRCLK